MWVLLRPHDSEEPSYASDYGSSPRCSLEACYLISPNPACAASAEQPVIRGNVAVVRRGATAPSTQSGAVLLELSRPECGTVGWDQLPPDVRFCREACRNESPALDHVLLPFSALDGETIM